MKITDSKHRIKELLNLTKDSQNEMARKCGLTKSAISNYVNGSREPRQDAILLISKAYNVNPAWLMGLDVAMEIENKEINIIRADAGTGKSDTITKALDFLQRYEDANPEVQAAIRTLLKVPQ